MQETTPRGATRDHVAIHRRRGSGLVRTVIVATGTLAILVVCFALYWYSQHEPPVAGRALGPRLPDTPSNPFPFQPNTTVGETSGVTIGGAEVGPARDIKLTLYPREGTRASLEIEVRDWVPKPGSGETFLLDEPVLRTRTKDGRAIRVTAHRGVLEAARRRGGALDPKRGWLTGGVVIEYDRLTAEQREQQNRPVGEDIPEDEIIRIQTEEIEFDWEYARFAAPQRITVTARELKLRGEGLEARFNEAAGRLESLRIPRGGELELLGSGQRVGLSIPSGEGLDAKPMTIVEWIQAAIRKRQMAQRAAAKPEEREPGKIETEQPREAVTIGRDGVPVFHIGRDRERTADEPVRYVAVLDGGVDVKQFNDEQLRMNVRAERMEILRELGDRQPLGSPSPTDKAPSAGPALPDNPPDDAGRLVLAWRGPLIVETVNEPAEPEYTSRLSFSGTPVRIESATGNVACDSARFFPESGKIELDGTADRPVVLGSPEEGTVTARSIRATRSNDLWTVDAIGPGTVARADGADGAAIQFAGRMEAEVRQVTKRTINRFAQVLTRDFRVLERAAFHDGVRVEQEQGTLTGEQLELAFSIRHGWATVESVLDFLHAEGEVTLEQEHDRLSCRRLEVEFTTDERGRTAPASALAIDDVVAVQESRRITASDRLRVTFAEMEGDAAAGEPSEVVPKEIHAIGKVTVTDPEQPLDLAGGELFCTFNEKRELESARVIRRPDELARVGLDTFTIAGPQIRVQADQGRAEVPGPGELTFMSGKDLNGRELREPVPVTVTWSERMDYRGRRDQAAFEGKVHLESETKSAVFDCGERLVVEFEDVAEPREAQPQHPAWRFAQDLWAQIVARARQKVDARDSDAAGGFGRLPSRVQDRSSEVRSKQLVYLLATGRAVAVVNQTDPGTGELTGRARLEGPTLSVNLRDEVSKMLIEGAGSLQLEDFRRPEARPSDAHRRGGGELFAPDASGPSKTLIVWQQAMWYDFAIKQTRFEGEVELKHFSGAELAKLFASARGTAGSDGDANAPTGGRATFLACRTLTVDFASRSGGSRGADRSSDGGLGGLSTAAMTRFEAAGEVVLQDPSEGLALWADRVVYEQQRQILAVFASTLRPARIIVQRRGRLPAQMSADRMIYNLATGDIELQRPLATGR